MTKGGIRLASKNNQKAASGIIPETAISNPSYKIPSRTHLLSG